MSQSDRAAHALPPACDRTGISSPNEPGQCQIEPSRRPLSLAWVSDELLIETTRLWSTKLERDVSQDEAIDMLRNIKRFAELLLERNER